MKDSRSIELRSKYVDLLRRDMQEKYPPKEFEIISKQAVEDVTALVKQSSEFKLARSAVIFQIITGGLFFLNPGNSYFLALCFGATFTALIFTLTLFFYTRDTYELFYPGLLPRIFRLKYLTD